MADNPVDPFLMFRSDPSRDSFRIVTPVALVPIDAWPHLYYETLIVMGTINGLIYFILSPIMPVLYPELISGTGCLRILFLLAVLTFHLVASRLT
jgi:hypothetical protein